MEERWDVGVRGVSGWNMEGVAPSNQSRPGNPGSASFSVATLLSFSSVARETAAGSSCCRGDILRDPAMLSAQVAARQKAETDLRSVRAFEGAIT